MRASRIVFALCLLCSSVAFAQAKGPSDDARVMASAHFRRGVELFHEEAFRAALVEFQRAYEIAPDFRLLYNIGQTKLELQDYLGAAQSYERYLAQGYLDIQPERRTEVESALTALRERVGSIAIKCNRNDAEIMLDDVRIGTAPITAPIMVNVGRHRVTARTPYGATDSEVIDVAGGDVANVSLELAKPTPQQVVVMQGEKPLNAMERSAIATWSAAGAVGVGALVTGLMANGAEKDLNKMLETRDLSRKTLGEQRDKVSRLAITTDVLIGTAAAAAVAGTVTWLLGHERETELEEKKKPAVATVRMNVGLGSLGVSGQF
jgi:hypothetical protein